MLVYFLIFAAAGTAMIGIVALCSIRLRKWMARYVLPGFIVVAVAFASLVGGGMLSVGVIEMLYRDQGLAGIVPALIMTIMCTLTGALIATVVVVRKRRSIQAYGARSPYPWRMLSLGTGLCALALWWIFIGVEGRLW